MLEQTFTILKPDLVSRNLIGQAINVLEQNGYKIIDMRMHLLDYFIAQDFYWEHYSKPFFESIITNICAGPVLLLLLEKENAIKDLRELVGHTNPAEAKEGTIRQLFGIDIDRNSIHASDSERSAKREINFFFGINSNVINEFTNI